MRPWSLTRARALWRRLADERGYTLTELLTTMAILGIVIGGLGQVFVSASNAETDMNRRFRAQQQTLLALDTLRREIHCANAAATTGAAGGVTYLSTASIKLTFDTSTCTLAGNQSVVWCAIKSSSGSYYELWRVAGATTCTSTGGRKVANYLMSSAALTPSAQSSTSLAKVSVVLPVVLPGSTHGAYRLDDDIVLRNSSRQ